MRLVKKEKKTKKERQRKTKKDTENVTHQSLQITNRITGWPRPLSNQLQWEGTARVDGREGRRGWGREGGDEGGKEGKRKGGEREGRVMGMKGRSAVCVCEFVCLCMRFHICVFASWVKVFFFKYIKLETSLQQ